MIYELMLIYHIYTMRYRRIMSKRSNKRASAKHKKMQQINTQLADLWSEGPEVDYRNICQWRIH